MGVDKQDFSETSSSGVVNVWDTILTFESAGLIALFGVIFAASFHFIGVLVNNYFENKRKKKQRHHDLIKDTYLGALNYLSFFYYQMLVISSGKETVVDENNIKATYNFYKLFLIAEPNVINVFTSTASEFSSRIYDLMEKYIVLKKCQGEEDIAEDSVQFALNNMQEVVQDLNRYNQENVDRPSLLDSYNERFSVAQNNFNQSSQIKEQKVRDKYQAQITLLREGIRQAADVSPAIYNCIFVMRKDLERNLDASDLEQINISINNMIEKLKSDTDDFINVVNHHTGMSD